MSEPPNTSSPTDPDDSFRTCMHVQCHAEANVAANTRDPTRFRGALADSTQFCLKVTASCVELQCLTTCKPHIAAIPRCSTEWPGTPRNPCPQKTSRLPSDCHGNSHTKQGADSRYRDTRRSALLPAVVGADILWDSSHAISKPICPLLDLHSKCAEPTKDRTLLPRKQRRSRLRGPRS